MKLPIDLTFKNKAVDLDLTDHSEYAKTLQLNLQNIYENVNINRDVSVNKQKLDYSRKVRAAEFEIGDRVWLHDKAKRVGRAKKISKHWAGPFTVLNKSKSRSTSLERTTRRNKKWYT